MKNSTVACGSSPVKIHYFDYLERFINRIKGSGVELDFIIYLSMIHLLNCLFSGHLIEKAGSRN